jgi:hypothetical protein
MVQHGHGTSAHAVLDGQSAPELASSGTVANGAICFVNISTVIVTHTCSAVADSQAGLVSSNKYQLADAQILHSSITDNLNKILNAAARKDGSRKAASSRGRRVVQCRHQLLILPCASAMPRQLR